jgi:hypothetical protein
VQAAAAAALSQAAAHEAQALEEATTAAQAHEVQAVAEARTEALRRACFWK